MGRYVSASSLGEAAKCPHGLYLQVHNAPINKRAQTARAFGNRDHESLNKRIETAHKDRPSLSKGWIVTILIIFIVSVMVINAY